MADGAAGVGEFGVDQADAGGLRVGGGGEADPVAVGESVQVHGEVGVHEGVAAHVEVGANAVDGVGDEEDALERRDRLIGDERVEGAEPGDRRAGADGARLAADLDGGVVADLPGEEVEGTAGIGVGSRG